MKIKPYSIRPWPIVILAIFHFVEPVFRIILNALLNDLGFVASLQRMIEVHGLPSTFFGLILFPIVGYCIYSCKRWSLPVFFVLELIVMVTNASFLYKLYSSGYYGYLSFFLGGFSLNLVVVGYFLTPSVRTLYVDPRLRWWEAKSARFKVSIPCQFVDLTPVSSNKIFGSAEITNISEGGVFINFKEKLELGHIIQLRFKFYNIQLSLRGVLAHTTGKGYGIAFVAISAHEHRELKNICKALKLLRVEKERKDTDRVLDFKQWALKLMTSGKGLFPEKITSIELTKVLSEIPKSEGPTDYKKASGE